MGLVLLTGSEGKPITNYTQSGSGVGKDLVAEYLQRDPLGFYHIKLAQELRNFVYDEANLDFSRMGDKQYEMEEKVLYQGKEYTPQQLLVTIAAFKTKEDPYCFVKSLVRNLKSLCNTEGYGINVVVSDVRQWPELAALKLIFRGEHWDIQRKSPQRPRQKLDCFLVGMEDFYINNNTTKQDLYTTVYNHGQIFKNQKKIFTPSMFTIFDEQPWNKGNL